jgi:hypothetical protein
MVVLPEPGIPVNHITGAGAVVEVAEEEEVVFVLISSYQLLCQMVWGKHQSKPMKFFQYEILDSSILQWAFLLRDTLLMAG